MAKELVVKLTLDSEAFEKGITLTKQEVEKLAKGADGAETSVGKLTHAFINAELIMRGVTLAWHTFKDLIKETIDASAEYQLAEAKVNATLHSRGQFSAAAVTEMKRLADETRRVTLETNSAALAAEAFLVGIGNVTKEQLPAVMKAVADMAAGTERSIEQTARTTAIAISGVTTTIRGTGITFEPVMNQVERVLSLQQQAAKRWGGEAAEAVNTWHGAVTQLVNAWTNLQRIVGDMITHSPAMLALIQAIVRVVDDWAISLERASGENDKLAASIHKAVGNFSAFAASMNALVLVAQVLGNVLAGIAIGLGVIVRSVFDFYMAVYNIVVGLFKGVATVIAGALNAVFSLAARMSSAIGLDEISAKFQGFANVTGDAMDDLAAQTKGSFGKLDGSFDATDKLIDGMVFSFKEAGKAGDDFAKRQKFIDETTQKLNKAFNEQLKIQQEIARTGKVPGHEGGGEDEELLELRDRAMKAAQKRARDHALAMREIAVMQGKMEGDALKVAVEERLMTEDRELNKFIELKQSMVITQAEFDQAEKAIRTVALRDITNLINDEHNKRLHENLQFLTEMHAATLDAQNKIDAIKGGTGGGRDRELQQANQAETLRLLEEQKRKHFEVLEVIDSMRERWGDKESARRIKMQNENNAAIEDLIKKEQELALVRAEIADGDSKAGRAMREAQLAEQDTFLAALQEKYGVASQLAGDLQFALWTTIKDAGLSAVESIRGGMNDAIFGMITGTATLADVWKATANSLLKTTIDMLTKMGLQWLIFSLLKKTLTAHEGATMMAVAAAQTFGNTFASISAIPIVGPFLAPAAAAVATSVMLAGAVGAGAAGAATGGALGAFETGSDYVPRTGAAYIHAGERIVPQQTNLDLTQFLQQQREGSGPGGVTINLSVGEFVGDQEHADRIVKIIDEAITLRNARFGR